MTSLGASAGTKHWPQPLPPHANMLPSLFSTRLLKSPAAIAMTSLSASGGSSHWPAPLPLQPQAMTPPSFSARLWSSPAAIALTPLVASAGTSSHGPAPPPVAEQPQASTLPEPPGGAAPSGLAAELMRELLAGFAGEPA